MADSLELTSSFTV